MPSHHESYTVKGLAVDFYCRDCREDDEAKHVAAAVTLLVDALLSPEPRIDDKWTRNYLRGTFRERLELAQLGELVPREECRPMGDGTFPLYEIRWQNLAISEHDPDGKVDPQGKPIPLAVTVHARLIHAEPDSHPYSVIALHAHEKIVVEDPEADESTWDLQTEELRLAAEKYHDGIPNTWGVTMRGAAST